MLDSIFQALKSGAVLLTASARQARVQQMAYAKRMAQDGHGAWPSPNIFTWGAWLERCWDELPWPIAPREGSDPDKLPSPVQEAALWEALIARSEFGDGLFQPHAVGRMAAQAWRLCWEWGIAPTDRVSPNEDVEAFAAWAREFDGECRRRGWQDRARLADAIGAAFERADLNASARHLLFGFDVLTPQQQRLLGILRRRGIVVDRIGASPAPNARVVRHELPGPLEEIASAARWARERLDAGALSIGVVVPDLGALRAQVARIFDDAFVPEAVLPGAPGTARPYNLSLGQALSQYPLVQSALHVLELGKGRISCAHLGGLLRSPFLGGAAAERPRRALLDVACRKGEPLVRFNELVRLAQDKDAAGQSRAHSAPLLASRLNEWRALKASLPTHQVPSVWAEGFARGLGALGWPGDRSLDSGEYQTVEAWRELLCALSTLDEVTGRMDYAAAFSLLARMAAERIFQPESPAVPVQVMGLLEASGLEFDCLWITGLDDAAWPASPRPNPFIPVELQRRHGLPHACAAWEFGFAQRLTAGLLSCAAQVIVSHPRRSGDEDLRPSPLIAHLPAEDAAAAGTCSALHPLILAARPPLESLVDQRAPPLAPGSAVSRGTGVFKDQAACPFRAFAHARLAAQALDEPEPGLDASERGILLHGALERVWRSIVSHANLCAWTLGRRQRAVRDAVAGAIADMARSRPQTFTARFVALEQSRLERLVLAWLEIEERRAPFTVIVPEKGRTASFGGLTVKVVPDRIDELEGGAHMVIDYKTGVPKLSQWFGDRPDDPQVPLYGLTQSDVAAVAFAQVRKDDSRFLGLTARGGLAPGVAAVAETDESAPFGSWEALLAEWRRVLEALGEEFRAGDARVAPKHGIRTCEYCDLGGLCRIREADDAAPVDSWDEA